MKEEFETAKALTWSIAALSRTSKFPSYQSWMGEESNNALSKDELEAKRSEHFSMIESLNNFKAKSEVVRGD